MSKNPSTRQTGASGTDWSLWEHRQAIGIDKVLSDLGLRKTPYLKELRRSALVLLRRKDIKQAYELTKEANGGKDYDHFPGILIQCAFAAYSFPRPGIYSRLKKRAAMAKALYEDVKEVVGLGTFPEAREDELCSMAFGGKAPPGVTDAELLKYLEILSTALKNIDVLKEIGIERGIIPPPVRKKGGRRPDEHQRDLEITLSEQFKKDFPEKPFLPIIQALLKGTFQKEKKTKSISSSVSRGRKAISVPKGVDVTRQ